MTSGPRYRIHFIPTNSSWLNPVAPFFALITETTMGRGCFTRVKDLVGRVDHFVTRYNKNRLLPYVIVRRLHRTTCGAFQVVKFRVHHHNIGIFIIALR